MTKNVFKERDFDPVSHGPFVRYINAYTCGQSSTHIVRVINPSIMLPYCSKIRESLSRRWGLKMPFKTGRVVAIQWRTMLKCTNLLVQTLYVIQLSQDLIKGYSSFLELLEPGVQIVHKQYIYICVMDKTWCPKWKHGVQKTPRHPFGWPMAMKAYLAGGDRELGTAIMNVHDLGPGIPGAAIMNMHDL